MEASAFSLLSLVSVASLFHLVATMNPNNTDFIRTSCALTLYPDRCFNSLYPFANKINKNPALLSRVAITVSLSWANHFVKHLNDISVTAFAAGPTRVVPGPVLNQASIRSGLALGPSNIFKALEDCVNELADVVDQIGGSLDQMERLGSRRERLRFDLNNVQTWMSSAITNEDTCIVGFNGVPDGRVKTDVILRVAELKEVTSNALSLVNSYVAKTL